MHGGHGDRTETGGESTLPIDADHPVLALALLGAGLDIEVALHGRAVWALGRAPDNDVVIDHRSVSRYHARLHAGDRFALEALAATNPVRFRDRALPPGTRVAVPPGEAFALGALVGVIRPLSRPARPAPCAAGAPRALRDALAEEERRRIVEALRRSAGNQSRAAELLGMPRRTLVKRLREYAIPRGRVIPDADR